jgi:murein DD-endopeptidase MepM/ murein hydrolase activator NlpD
MVVETPNKSAISSLKFFNRTARINQESISVSKEKLVQIDISLKKILSVKERSVDTSKIEEEETRRQEKEKKLEAGKFFVKGVGKLTNAIPGKNTIQKFLLFMAFGWLFNTFSKYFGELSGPLSKVISGAGAIIDAFSKIAFGIFDGFVTFIDIGYKTWDVIRGTGDSQKLQSALNNVLLDIDSFFGGILSLLGIVEKPPEQQAQPGALPGAPSGSEGQKTSPSTGSLPRLSQQPGQVSPPSTPQAPPSQVSGGIIPSQGRITSTYGSQEGFRKKPHTGIDYGYDVGTPISIVKSGVVVEASMGYNGGYGNFVLVKHSNGTYSMFNHLDQIYVKKGQKINASTGNAPVIGTIGNSGFSTGPHLDFKVATKWDGFNPSGFVDPRSYQDSVFRIGGDVKVKPSEVQKLAKKNGKEGVMINGQWRAKPWSSEEKERYGIVSGEQKSKSNEGPSAVSGDNIDKKVLDFISKGEASQKDPYGGFNTSRGRTEGRAVDKTIGWLSANARGAIGRYQHMPEFLLQRARAAGFDENTKFTPEVQDQITLHFLRTSHSYDAWKSGKISDEDFLSKLSPTWRAIPQGPQNAAKLGGSIDSTYNDRYSGGNRSSRSWSSALSDLKSVRYSSQQSSAKSTPSSQSADVAAQEYAASKGKYYSSTTKKTYGSYAEALKDPEVKKAATKPERWATDPRGWFGMKGGGIVNDIPRQTKKNDVSSLESYPSYSPESGESMQMVIQPVIIKVPKPSGRSRSTEFPVAIGVNNSMSNLSNLSQG